MQSQFNGVKVFSATMLHERERLGDRVTEWLAAQESAGPFEIVERKPERLGADRGVSGDGFQTFQWIVKGRGHAEVRFAGRTRDRHANRD